MSQFAFENPDTDPEKYVLCGRIVGYRGRIACGGGDGGTHLISSVSGTTPVGFIGFSLAHQQSERVRFVCLRGGVSPVAFRFDLVAAVEDDFGVETETVLVVPAAALAAISVGAVEEPEHVAVREVVLDAFQRRERGHGV